MKGFEKTGILIYYREEHTKNSYKLIINKDIPSLSVAEFIKYLCYVYGHVVIIPICSFLTIEIKGHDYYKNVQDGLNLYFKNKGL
jgi:hypothetical protein